MTYKPATATAYSCFLRVSTVLQAVNKPPVQSCQLFIHGGAVSNIIVSGSNPTLLFLAFHLYKVGKGLAAASGIHFAMDWCVTEIFTRNKVLLRILGFRKKAKIQPTQCPHMTQKRLLSVL